MHPRVSPNAFTSKSFFPFLASCCALLLTLTGTAQEKPGPKPTAPAKQRQRQSVPSGNTGAVKDPVAGHYRAAETFQLAGDLNAAEIEYRHCISLALQRVAGIQVLAQAERQALVLGKDLNACKPLKGQRNDMPIFNFSGVKVACQLECFCRAVVPRDRVFHGPRISGGHRLSLPLLSRCGRLRPGLFLCRSSKS